MKIQANANLMHHLFLWVQNWKHGDFEAAFFHSPLGWRYQWEKFESERNRVGNASSAMLNTVLGMDNAHQEMLFQFICEKYINSIQGRARNIAFMKEFDPSQIKT